MKCPSAPSFLGRTCDESMASIHSTSKLISHIRGAMVVIWWVELEPGLRAWAQIDITAYDGSNMNEQPGVDPLASSSRQLAPPTSPDRSNDGGGKIALPSTLPEAVRARDDSIF